MKGDMCRNWSRIEHSIELAFLGIFTLLLVYAIVALLDLHPLVQTYKPAGFLFLMAALWLQSVSKVFLQRSRRLRYMLLLVSMALLVAGVVEYA